MKRYMEYEKRRQDGRTLQSIADEFGVSKQAVSFSLKRAASLREPFQFSGTGSVAYDNVRKWLVDNHCSVSKLEKMAGMRLRSSLVNHTLRLDQARTICRITGLDMSSI